jgi:hypothetical protein
MAIVLEECITEKQRLLCVFYGQKDLMQRNVYGRKCLSHKAVHNRVADVSLMKKGLKRRYESGRDNSQKTSMLRVSTHW